MSIAELIAASGEGRDAVRAVVKRPPASIGDTVRVAVPAFSGEHFYEVRHWSPRGTAWPQAEDEALIVTGEDGEPWLLWDGAFEAGGFGTSLPTSPADGEEFTFKVGSGVLWRFKFNGGGASGKKWEFIGGAPLVVSDNDARTLTNQTTYANLPTDPMSVTLPALAGDYDIEIQADLYSGSNGLAALLSYAVGGTAASDTWAIAESNTITLVSAAKRTRHTGVSSGATIAEKGRTSSTNSGTFSGRRILIWPVRVG